MENDLSRGFQEESSHVQEGPSRLRQTHMPLPKLPTPPGARRIAESESIYFEKTRRAFL